MDASFTAASRSAGAPTSLIDERAYEESVNVSTTTTRGERAAHAATCDATDATPVER